MGCSTPGFPVHHQLPELTQTHVHRVSDAIQPSHPLSSPSPPTFNLSQHQVLPNEVALHIRWSKYRSFSFSISPSYEYSGLIFFRIDWLDLLAVQGTLKSSPTPQTFVGKVTSLLFNLSSLLTAFFLRSKCLLISWLQSLSAVILEPQKELCHCLHCFSIYLPWTDGIRCHDLSFLNAEF